MRLTVLSCIAMAGLLCATAPAVAKSKVLVRTKTYAIAGTTGEALLHAMDRKGPKQGFMTHAIAQTRYTVDWELKVSRSGDGCRLDRADATLNVTYTYPQVEERLSPAMRKRWNRFFAGVRKHEETHGRIARQMVREAERTVAGLKVADDSRCTRTRREAKRRIDAVYDAYEARQIEFDRREHSEGGNVEGLVTRLLGKH
jgi:predicted secreted Zn-dependent protease